MSYWAGGFNGSPIFECIMAFCILEIDNMDFKSHKCIVVFGFGILVLSIFAKSINAKDVSVSGYTRSDGTYVAPHYRSAPDGSFDNNWSTLGNINPHTGRLGTLTSPDDSYRGNVTLPANISTSGQGDDYEDDYEDDESEESPIVLPVNARLNVDGSDWECEQGYNRSGDGCVAVHSPYNAK
jgi:hypothetical protein